MEFDLIKVGHLKKTFGREGGLKLALHDAVYEWIEPGMFLFVDLDGNLVPYALSGLEFKSDLIAYFEGINTPEEANLLTSREVSVERKILNPIIIKELEGGGLEFDFLAGYELFHPVKGKIGPIQSIEPYPQQEMAIVSRSNGSDLLIPLNKEYIIEIDRKLNRVFVVFPEELLDL